jgi:large subunit ribosomal protein L34e
MVAGNRRSRTLRRLHRKTPGGVTRIKYVKRIPPQPGCRVCGDVLKGVPRARARQLHGMSKTEKRPSRPFGGQLCSRCMRLEMIKRARMIK